MTNEKETSDSNIDGLDSSAGDSSSEVSDSKKSVSTSNSDQLAEVYSIEENPTDLSTSATSSVPSILYDAIPPIQDQRSMIASMWARFNEEKKEGDVVFIIPENWLTIFQDLDIADYRTIPPLDIASIVIDCENFILQDYTLRPYTAVPSNIFNSVRQWYGLTADSRPISTFMVKDSNNQLIVEYDKPRFRVHHLSVEAENSTAYSGSNRHAIEDKLSYMFTISRLSTMKDVVQNCLKVFYSKELQLDRDSHIHRIWYINENDPNSNSNQVLQNNYVISPSVFLELQTKHKITKDMYQTQIRDYDSHIISLAVEVKEKESHTHWPSNFLYYNKEKKSSGIMGLSNLGNTCYMNSALQCLLHVPELNEYFLYKGYEAEINVDNPLGHKGHVAHAFGHLLQSLFGSTYKKKASFLAPRNFKSIIGHYNHLFAGFGQQDSQEFLAFLLDGLHEDLNRVIEKPYVQKPELANDCHLDDTEQVIELASKTWSYIKQRNDSIIMDLFVGLYKSTLVCPNCNFISITFDPYNDLTLPLPIEKYWSAKVMIFPQGSPPCTLEVELVKTSTYNDLKAYVASHANMNRDDLIGFEIFNHQFYNNYESNMEADYLPISELISDNDTVIFYEIYKAETDLLVPVFNTRIEEGYKTPKLFGYPFFIALSKSEKCSYGAIRKKIERCYQTLSGGFTDFPIIGKSEPTTMSSMPSLVKKYRQSELQKLTNELDYINPAKSVDEYFQLKVLDGDSNHSNRRTTGYGGVTLSQNSTASKPTVWTPTSASSINYNNSKPLRDLLPEVIDAAYYYSDSLFDEVDPTEAFIEPENLPKDEHSDDDMTDRTDALDVDSQPEDLALIDVHNAIICQWHSPKVEEVFNVNNEVSWEAPALLENLTLLESRKQRLESGKATITLDSCLRLFSQPEVLGSADSWYCPNCKQHTQASKQIELWSVPDILLIHLKRFENQQSFSDKIDATVHFPIEGLDMSPYLSHTEEGGNNIYDLIAVDNHYGGLGGGHYTAYCRNFVDGKWYYFDDSRVSETSPENSVAGSAYLLFYRRRVPNNQILGNSKLREIINVSRKEYEQKENEFKESLESLYSITHTDTENEVSGPEQNSGDEEEDVDTSIWKKNSKEAHNDVCDIAFNISPHTRYSDYSSMQSKGSHPKVLNNSEVMLESDSNVNISEKEQSVPVERKSNPQYNVSSLEVGDNIAELDTHDSSRRKLRLLDKVYLPDSSDVNSSRESLSPCISQTNLSSNNSEPKIL
ncbi:unnamed protein product [Kluyveromyces dobzhanskii CBS 2104]|uniref:ubiquitinyl hydrolase 1 n=1 Tax=Kluyveromyces dobzhanskii CBS 2104 TaxID=1427455 RepID=A0A0A8L3Q2_9SACH|nr:unnamed protein product [Kluyveromyces dobzhanskii CBS 2104]